MSKVKVPPNPNYVAEVVVLLTSLGVKRSELNAGRRACDILEIKRAHRKVIDVNMDARAGRESGEEKAIARLEARNETIRGVDGELLLPQVFVDGSYLGDTTVLQALEDDGLLGRILRRKLCLKCHGKKDQEAMTCPSCGAEFEEILPQSMTIDEELGLYYGSYGPDDRAEESSDSGEEADERYAAYEAETATQARRMVPVVPRPGEAAAAASRRAAARRQRGREGRDGSSFERTQRSFHCEGPAGSQGEVPAAVDAAESLPAPPATARVAAAGAREEGHAQKREALPKHVEEQGQCGRLPELQGYLWKKSPNQLRLLSYEKRYFVVKDLHVYWWKTRQEAQEAQGHGVSCKGYIDLAAGPAELRLMAENDTTFSLVPKDGLWAAGAIAKGDPSRAFTLDATGSEHRRERWVHAIFAQLKRADKMRPQSTDVVVASDSFYAAVGLPTPSSLRQ